MALRARSHKIGELTKLECGEEVRELMNSITVDGWSLMPGHGLNSEKKAHISTRFRME